MDVLIKVDQVLPILYGLNVRFDSKYCFPGQKKILSLLVRFRSLKISIATINRWLRVLEDEGYIKRTRRIKAHKRLGQTYKSTLYHITKKGYWRLARFIDGVNEWYKRMFENGAERKKESPGKNNNHFVEQMDKKVLDLAAGVFKKPIY